jgi:hypothetical protein
MNVVFLIDTELAQALYDSPETGMSAGRNTPVSLPLRLLSSENINGLFSLYLSHAPFNNDQLDLLYFV